MPLAIQPVTPAIATIAADLGVALQPGTVVDARVLQVLDANLVRIAIASLTLDVPTATPLQQGQTLQLAVVQTAIGLSLTPVKNDGAGAVSARGVAVIVDDIPLAPRAPGQPTALQPTLTPQQAEAVATAAQNAVTKQAGLSPLFANLSAAVASHTLPPQVLVAAAQLLGMRLPGTANLTGGDIKAALQSSGLVMEAALGAPSLNAPPDIKSNLLLLRQALTRWQGPSPEVATSSQPTSPQSQGPAQVTSNAFESFWPLPESAQPMTAQVATALKVLGAMTESAEPGEAPRSLLAAQLIASALRPRAEAPVQTLAHASQPVPPPVRGLAPTPQSVAAPTLTPDAAPAVIARELIADTDGALARQTLLQIASLPDRPDLPMQRHDPMQPRWNFEIPFITPQGTAMAQLEIARDGGGTEAEAAQRIWRARFSLDIEPAGPVHALIAFSGDITSVKMWAERPETAAQLRATAFQLTQTLDRAELKAGEIVVADGAPSRDRVASGHFLNRAT